MRHLIIVLAAILAIASASPLKVDNFKEKILLADENARNTIIEQIVLSLFEEIRQAMVDGSGNIPVLDPFGIDEIYVDQNVISIIPGYVSIKDMIVKGLSTFVVNDLSINMASLQNIGFTIDGSIPLVDVDVGGYDLELTIYGGRIFGSGDGKFKIAEPRANVDLALSLSLSDGIFLQIRECRISVSLDSFDPEISGMFNDPVLNEFVNVFLKMFVEEGLVLFESEVTEFLSTNVMELGNRLLADLDLSDFFETNKLLL
ncbi:uncharacterized protein [Battus philenor]|uniref:uncharacterized protein n=1 Tax=Battus philenor TaxID=42288 RepID=UPI0035CECCD9